MCVLCIQETGSQDQRVGGPTRVFTFSTSKDFIELSPSEVDKLVTKNNQFQIRQKSRFYPEDPNTGTDNPKK